MEIFIFLVAITALSYFFYFRVKTIEESSEIINQEKENFHYFVPTLNLEWGKLPKKRIGYFFKGFFGTIYKFIGTARNI